MNQMDMFRAPVLDLDKARALRDEGMARVEAHANEEHTKWGDYAFVFLMHYARGHEEFMIEDVRAAAVGFVPEPPDSRAWGPVAHRAAREGRIEVVRYEKQRDAKSHGSPKPVWRAVARPS